MSSSATVNLPVVVQKPLRMAESATAGWPRLDGLPCDAILQP